MDYRELFEKTEKQEPESQEKLEELANEDSRGLGEYSSWESGGLLSINIKDADQKQSLAFILDKRVGIPSAGVAHSTDFGVIKDGIVCRRGYKLSRGGRADDVDDFHGWYSQVKILEEKDDKVILGLKSGKALDIYEVDLKNSNVHIMRFVKRYDLEAEAREAKQKDLEEKASATENFEEKLKLFGEKLQESYKRARRPVSEIIERDGEKVGIIAIVTSDRDYDANLDAIYYYGMKQGDEKPTLLKTHYPEYRVRGRFFGANVSISFEEEDNKIMAVMKYSHSVHGYHTESSGRKEEKIELTLEE